MKRAPELASLSRDHHQALFVAQQLRRATDDTAPAARDACLAFWTGHGSAHFRAEEELLLPAYAAHGDPYDPLVARVLCDHVAIRRLVAALADDPSPSLETIHDIGTRLADHVRLEERQLFPQIEAALPDDELTALGRSLLEAERENRL